MTPLHRLQDPSLRFLLWLEWILLGITALGEVRQRFQLFDERSPLLSLFCVIILCLLGLQLPQRNPFAKVIYAAINLSLVLLASIVGHIQFFFLLCVVLMLRSYLVFGRPGRWLSTAVVFAVFIGVQSYRIQAMNRLGNFDGLKTSPDEITRPFLVGAALLFALVLIFLQLMISALLSERNSRQQLAIAHSQLRQYALQIEEIATLQERTRIAREIHDTLGHSLTALNLNLNAALGLWGQEPEEAQNLFCEAQTLSQSALKDVRQAVATLRSDPRETQPLTTLIQKLVTRLQQTTGIQAVCTIQPCISLPERYKTAAYRVVQEALTNITKHAQATEVSLQIQTERTQTDYISADHTQTKEEILTIIIQDNGQGFEREQTTSGFGLRGMEERILALGGTLSLDTRLGQGCHIVVRLPILPSNPTREEA